MEANDIEMFLSPEEEVKLMCAKELAESLELLVVLEFSGYMFTIADDNDSEPDYDEFVKRSFTVAESVGTNQKLGGPSFASIVDMLRKWAMNHKDLYGPEMTIRIIAKIYKHIFSQDYEKAEQLANLLSESILANPHVFEGELFK